MSKFNYPLIAALALSIFFWIAIASYAKKPYVSVPRAQQEGYDNFDIAEKNALERYYLKQAKPVRLTQTDIENLKKLEGL